MRILLGLICGVLLGLAVIAWASNGPGLSPIRSVDSVGCRNDSLLVTVGGEVRYVPREWTLCEYGPNRLSNKHKKRPRP